MPDVRIVGISAAAAFVISLFSGIIGGVGFLTILLRAVLGAVIFAILTGGMYIVLERMIPELFESDMESTGEEDTEDASTTGGNVDITLGEDAKPLAGAAENREQPPADFAAEAGADDEEGGEDFVEELAEEDSRTPAAAGPSGIAASGGDGSTGGEEDDAPAAPASEDTEEAPGAGEVDSLPDLEDFADSFEGVAASQEEGSSGGGLGGASSTGVDVMGDHHDSETVVKAVRTFMKKDQEG